MGWWGGGGGGGGAGDGMVNMMVVLSYPLKSTSYI